MAETIGTVDTQRHRKNGYTALASYDFNIGLQGTKSFHIFNLAGEYHKTLNKMLQLSTWLRTGEIYGKSFYSAYAGTHFTWLNSKWLSLENAYFLNWGSGTDK